MHLLLSVPNARWFLFLRVVGALPYAWEEKLTRPSQFALLDVQRATTCNFYGSYNEELWFFHILFHSFVENIAGRMAESLLDMPKNPITDFELIQKS